MILDRPVIFQLVFQVLVVVLHVLIKNLKLINVLISIETLNMSVINLLVRSEIFSVRDHMILTMRPK